MSSCLEMKLLTLSTSVFLIPFSSEISLSHVPWIFSAAVLSLISSKDSESENHAPPSFAISVLLPMPPGPESTGI